MFAASICAWVSSRTASFIRGVLVQETGAIRHTNLLCFYNDAKMHADLSNLLEHDGCVDTRENETRNKSIQFQVHSYTKKA